MTHSRSPYQRGWDDAAIGLEPACSFGRTTSARRYHQGYAAGATARRQAFHALRIYLEGGELVR